MLELLQDKPLELAGAAFALIAIFVSIVIYYLQRQRKELAFGVLSEHHLLGVDEELADRVVVTFDGQSVKNIKLVIFGVKNSGNQPILINDFEGRSMRFTFGENAKVLSTEIIRQSPQNLGCGLDVVENEVLASPLLLNPADYFVVKTLVSAPEIDMQVDTRIIGVPNILPLHVGTPERISTLELKFLWALFFPVMFWTIDGPLMSGLYFDLLWIFMGFLLFMGALNIVRVRIENATHRYIGNINQE